MGAGIPVWAMWLVYALAVARLTGLAATDEISRPARQWLIDRLDMAKGWHRRLVYAAGGASEDGDGCPWCVSVWVGGVVVPVAYWCGDHPAAAVPALALAASQITGMISGLGRG